MILHPLVHTLGNRNKKHGTEEVREKMRNEIKNANISTGKSVPHGSSNIHQESLRVIVHKRKFF